MKKSIKNITLKKEHSGTHNEKLIPHKNTEVDLAHVAHQISEAKDQIKEDFSYKKRFFGGVLHGLGAAIGATIVFALMISLATKLIAGSKHIKWLNDIIEKTQIEEIIDTSKAK